MGVQQFSLPLKILNLTVFFLLQPFIIIAQPEITPSFKCVTNEATCQALGGYVPTENTTLNRIQNLFQVTNLSSLLRANFLPLSTPENYNISAFQTVRVPFPCRCSNGTGLSDGLPVYTVSKAEAGNGLAYIANVLFQRLTTTQKIQDVNQFNDSSNPIITEGQKLWIPLPCSCDNVEGEKVVHYAHVVEFESSLDQVAAEFGVKSEILKKLYTIMPSDSEFYEGQVIDVPLNLPAAVPSQVDGAAMKSLASALTNLPSWLGSNFCMWIGVICDTNGFVKSINLVSLDLVGILPSSMNSLSQLSAIFFQNNYLYGPLPSFKNLTLLQEIHLDSNNFTSVSDGAFSSLRELKILSLEDNFGLHPWGFPIELAEMQNLVGFYASNANLIGTIPYIFQSLTSLRDLRLSNNSLTGSLPDSLRGCRIENFWLDNQHVGLTGTLDVLEQMTSLKQVWLQGNNFSGPIPDLSNCSHLFDLQLKDNDLTGAVPTSLISLPSLLNISLENNMLQGPFPSFPDNITVNIGGNSFCKNVKGDCDPQVTTLLEVARALGYPVELAKFWHRNNVCNAWTYVTCDTNGNVITINMSKQGFNGTISPALAHLIHLSYLYLSNNNLTGIIPDNLTTLPLLKLIDVSNNTLGGKVPSFRSSVTVLTSGNRNIQPASTPNTIFGGKRSSGKTTKILAGVLVPLASIVVLSILIYIYKKKKYRAEVLEQWEDSQLVPDSQMRFTYKALKVATNDFDMEKKLGGGGFGTVFEGNLSDGTRVAVKRLDRVGQGRKEFLAEVRTMGSIHHLNLVNLIGFCAEDSHRLLVYEYMGKGSLDNWIFDIDSRNVFTWETKKQIILHIAKGLAYLHEECQKRIAHLDIKPQNVLLDDDFNAKISDFGLARLIDRDQNYVMTQMRGTRGYLAPEWLGRKITERADVYSYGVVVLEVIFGKKNLDSTRPEESTLIMQVKKKAEESQLFDILDTWKEDTQQNIEDIEKTIELAIRCLHSEPGRRPSMSMTVKVLEGAVSLLDIDDYASASPVVTEISDSILSGPR